MMSNDKKIPDAETRAKSVARLKEVCLMFDALNMTLDEAIASAERDVRNNPHNIRRREQASDLFDTYKRQE
jgi:hypothetical protein